MTKIREYYWLAKPGMVYGNSITAMAGFFFASKGDIDLGLFIATIAGLALVMASGCVLNNYYDRGIDSKMERTKHRAIVEGKIIGRNAIVYGTVLGAAGFFVLWRFTNLTAVIAALVGAVVYVLVYTPLKHKSVHATLVGSVAGAMPIVVGYTAVTVAFDLRAFILFLILTLWQMPHFYSIAIRRLDEYKTAEVPTLPLVRGVRTTKIRIVLYVLAFGAAALSLVVFSLAGYAYGIVALALVLWWLTIGLRGFRKGIEDEKWAKQMFLVSLAVLMVWSISISVESVFQSIV